ncbi:aspartic proteinase nepenthesin-1-like [Triticum dicoccoides]|uniref:aspartic proteinase nepenthesin-1-like n=1 Tax=Triticum dicoccoides TaxID=85692 RepID=UPI000E7BF06A|nr:aspartic proteinase nepenthesin-1-like [Triticum dicoccoides]
MARTLVFLLVLLCSSASLVRSSTSAGLRMKLTHVDDKAGYTTEERVRRAVSVSRERRASTQQQQQRRAFGDVSAPVHLATRQYIAEYLIGDPPQRSDALIDTGSNLIWTQCATTCLKACAKQDLPYYNLSSSASFAPVPCADSAKLCAANGVHLCGLDGSCTFIASYGAGSIIGSLGTEAFTFQSGAARLAFGCVSLTQITKGALNGASGLIGLGRGRLSLISQTGATKFSYCLTPYFRNHGASSHLFVGASASLSGGRAVTSIPFVKSPKEYPYSTFYYLPLVGISVGKTKLPIPSAVFELRRDAAGYWSGGVIIDTGSPVTSLADAAYRALSEEVTRQLNHSLVQPPGDTGLDLCVARQDVNKVVPALVFHFSGGADMAVPPGSYWGPVDKSTACMLIEEGGYESVIGNFQQQDLHLLYDIGKGELSFQTADCSVL